VPALRLRHSVDAVVSGFLDGRSALMPYYLTQ